MDFLALCKRTRQECGLSGDGPAAVGGQTGVYAKVVDWVRAAYEDIQRRASDWRFDWVAETRPLVAGKAAYDLASDWGLAIKSLDPEGLSVRRIGSTGETWLDLVEWATFRPVRLPGVTGLPVLASVAPDGRLHFHPVPTAGLEVSLEGYLQPQALEQNGDTPRLPERYHMAIVWRAVMYWAAHDEAPGPYQSAERNFRAIMHAAALSELPEIRMPGALA